VARAYVCKNYSERLNKKGKPGDGDGAKEGANSNGEPLVAPDIKVKAVPKVKIVLCVLPLNTCLSLLLGSPCSDSSL
jgi:hypothetical protein